MLPAELKRPANRIALYERDLPCSVERVWENVRDWEHLPYLHNQAFQDIVLESSDEGGWRARATIAGGQSVDIHLDMEVEDLFYTTHTVDADDRHTAIVTTLSPTAERETAIEVEFFVAELNKAEARLMGELYLDVYRQLWDQDVEMMLARQALLDSRAMPASQEYGGPRRLLLGLREELDRRLPLDVSVRGVSLRVDTLDGDLIAYSPICPHRGGPLQRDAGSNQLTCPWHGYRFDLTSRASCDGQPYRLGGGAAVGVDANSGQVFVELE